MKKRLTTLFLITLLMTLLSVSVARPRPRPAESYKKPVVCLNTNIRCVLKKTGDTKYWCLKSNLQRNLDGRRNTNPLTKTYRGNLGNCAQTIRIFE